MPEGEIEPPLALQAERANSEPMLAPTDDRRERRRRRKDRTTGRDDRVDGTLAALVEARNPPAGRFPLDSTAGDSTSGGEVRGSERRCDERH